MENLIFIPYQDIFDFTNTGILTREYSMLHFFKSQGVKKVYFVSKPRTILDKKKLKENEFPDNSVEAEVYHEILNGDKFRFEPFINTALFLKKRAWWVEGYEHTIKLVKNKNIDYKKTIVYSNNPFAYELLYYLKKQGATVYFDMMDNFAIHPSLNNSEQEVAEVCYKKIFSVANFITCNSKSILEFSEDKFKEKPVLIKNGVFPTQQNIKVTDVTIQNKLNELLEITNKYKTSIGYIGKLGLRLDEHLIENIVVNNPEVLFVFIGPHLTGQKNIALDKLFNKYENIISLGSIHSSYVNIFLEQFSMLMIPHSVGKYENGGDPLKLYQYLNLGKPIISTCIEGVDEFGDIITISNNYDVWDKFVKQDVMNKELTYEIPETIFWDYRLQPLKKFLTKE